MVKAEVKTPNKRKSIGNDTPAKKLKLENGKNNEKTPKKQLQTPKKEFQTPKKEFQSPKTNKQASVQKSNKKNKSNSDSLESPSDKKFKPFKPIAGTKKVGDLKQNKQKPQISAKKEGNSQPQEKKRRKNQYHKLMATVKTKSGTNDQELINSIEEKIESITSRGELTKTARRKLATLQKMKSIVEEGADVVAARMKAQVQADKAAKGKVDKKTAPQQTEQGKKKKAALLKAKEADEEDSDEEMESDDEEAEAEDDDESGEEEEDSDAEAEGEDDDDEEEEEDDDDGDEEEDDEEDDDDSDEEPPAPKEKPPAKKAKMTQEDKPKVQKEKQVDLDKLKNSNLVSKGQKRFVLFVGNIPYDTTREDLLSHFSKAGDIVHVRLPTEKGGNRPRGFGYIEVKDEITYQKCLSMHHTQIKGRRINVLYTQGGKKKTDEKKKEIKVKNMKLHGLRTQGKLAGSVKQSQKRSFRRNKSKEAQKARTEEQ